MAEYSAGLGYIRCVWAPWELAGAFSREVRPQRGVCQRWVQGNWRRGVKTRRVVWGPARRRAEEEAWGSKSRGTGTGPSQASPLESGRRGPGLCARARGVLRVGDCGADVTSSGCVCLVRLGKRRGGGGAASCGRSPASSQALWLGERVVAVDQLGSGKRPGGG